MWHLKVDKTLHVYWGGGALPYMRYLTVKSFMDLNPGWEVNLWMSSEKCNKVTWRSGENDYRTVCDDYFPQLLKLPVIRKVIDFKKFGFVKESAEVHKADYIRIAALKYYGGVWSDMDIIYFRPIEDIYVNDLRNRDKEVFVCVGPYGHSTGFLMAQEESQMFNLLSDNISRGFNPLSYQCLGPDIFNRYFRDIKKIPSSVNLSMDVVYSHDEKNQKDLLNLNEGRFTDKSIGCHWYGGHPMWSDFIKKTNGGLKNLPDNIIGNLINGQLRNTSKSIV